MELSPEECQLAADALEDLALALRGMQAAERLAGVAADQFEARRAACQDLARRLRQVTK